MVSVGDFFSGLLKGDFLVRDDSVNNWKVIFVVLGMSIVMITCSHQTDEKVMKIAALSKKLKKVKAEYIDGAAKVTFLKLESTVKPQVSSSGLLPSENPPVIIKVKNK